jgi:hypothetical protein
MSESIFRPTLRTKRLAIGSTVFLAFTGMNAPAAVSFAQVKYHEYVISRPEYKRQYGSWTVVNIPEAFQVNAIHATLLNNGKVLIIAGSGNEKDNFKAGTFRTLLWDPVKNTYKLIHTPADMFCAGHTSLADGQVLVAGGTLRYEVLKPDVKKAGGTMQVRNEDPNRSRKVPKGTVFVSPAGDEYVSNDNLVVPAAAKVTKMVRNKQGVKAPKTVVVTAQQAVFVEARDKGKDKAVKKMTQFRVKGLKGNSGETLYGMAKAINFNKQDYQGIKAAYEFNPDTELYEKVQPMQYARWYPTLVQLPDSKIMTVSGLDDTGYILNGQNEIFDPKTTSWSPAATHYFPTYPALFLTADQKLFYSGSNGGYGPPTKGRVPGIWDWKKNTFTKVPGLRDANTRETSPSVLLPPAQDQKVMILGGGKPGESRVSTAHTDIVDLSKQDPKFTAGPDLPAGGTRYLSAVIMPDDTVFTTGGSADYRGKHGSDILKAQTYHPDTNTFTNAADPTVGRDYHSEALLLPDGRVVTFGSNPLFGDKGDTLPPTFEKRIEIYTPAYLYQGGERPQVTGGTTEAVRGKSADFTTPDASKIATVRLMRPSSVTHVTDVQQRSIALDFKKTASGITTTIPKNSALVPSGWYMLFVADKKGVPSVAHWVHVK